MNDLEESIETLAHFLARKECWLTQENEPVRKAFYRVVSAAVGSDHAVKFLYKELDIIDRTTKLGEIPPDEVDTQAQRIRIKAVLDEIEERE